MKKTTLLATTLMIFLCFTSCKTTYACLVCNDGSTPTVEARNDEKADELCKEKDCAGSIEILTK